MLVAVPADSSLTAQQYAVEHWLREAVESTAAHHPTPALYVVATKVDLSPEASRDATLAAMAADVQALKVTGYDAPVRFAASSAKTGEGLLALEEELTALLGAGISGVVPRPGGVRLSARPPPVRFEDASTQRPSTWSRCAGC